MANTAFKGLTKLFLTTQVNDLHPRITKKLEAKQEGEVVVLELHENLPAAFRTLTEAGITAAPVIRKTEFGHDYVGFIDMLTLVRHTTNLWWGQSPEDWTAYMQKSHRFQSTTVKDLLRLNTESPKPIQENFTTLFALEQLAKGYGKQTAIMNKNMNKCTGIITQSMFISWVNQNRDLLGDLADLPVSAMIKQRVVSINEKDNAINAFYKMVDQGVDVVAVVDSAGMLKSAISARDLRGVGADGESFARLFIPIPEFKRQTKIEYPTLVPEKVTLNPSEERYGTPRKGIYVLPVQNFCDVLRYMCDGNIHQVFVCTEGSHLDGTPRATHTISQQDVLRQIMSFLAQPQKTLQVVESV